MISSFSGKWAGLSNFAPVVVEFEGRLYPSVEHAFQAAKTLDPSLREQIAQASTPGRAKQLGRRASLRPGWDQMRIDVMRELLEKKFATPTYKALLEATGDEDLVEGNDWHDRFWGAVWLTSENDWDGENHLGRLLMTIRRGKR